MTNVRSGSINLTTDSASLKSTATRWLLIVVAVCAFASKLVLALNTYGTSDVVFWESNAKKIRVDGGLALYREGAQIYWNGEWIRNEPFNQPPFMINVLRLWDIMSDKFGLPLRFWLRLTSSIADIGSLFLIWKILLDSKLPFTLLQLLLVASSPVSIMIAGFHGNTDPLMMFLILLSVYFAGTDRPTWFAGAAFGMAMSIKIVPLIFAPVFLMYLPTLRKRVDFTLPAAVIFITGSMPYLAQDPMVVIFRVFGYSSAPFTWGLSRVTYVFLPAGASVVYQSVGKPLALVIVLLASAWLGRQDPKPALFLQCGFIGFVFLFVSSGFGTQYLAWLIPWGAALTGSGILFHQVISTAFLYNQYTLWPVGFGRVAKKGLSLVVSLELICWLSVGFVALTLYRRLRVSAHSGYVR